MTPEQKVKLICEQMGELQFFPNGKYKFPGPKTFSVSDISEITAEQVLKTLKALIDA